MKDNFIASNSHVSASAQQENLGVIHRSILYNKIQTHKQQVCLYSSFRSVIEFFSLLQTISDVRLNTTQISVTNMVSKEL